VNGYIAILKLRLKQCVLVATAGLVDPRLAWKYNENVVKTVRRSSPG
jgi:hypothetical protein